MEVLRRTSIFHIMYLIKNVYFLYKYSTTHIIIQLYKNIRCIKNVKNNTSNIIIINEISRTTYNQKKQYKL